MLRLTSLYTNVHTVFNCIKISGQFIVLYASLLVYEE